jgi:murein DD-endopeptidase MepM/ murein hydrolase activator NlpD
MVVVSLVLGAGWGGYELGVHDIETAENRLVDSLHGLFDAEHRQLQAEKKWTEEHLNALARKMGEMQAQVLRMEALGERLAELGKLDRTEFDFGSVPAMGGPETPDDLATRLPELLQDLEDLARRIEDRETKLGVLEDLLLQRQVREDTRPAGRPVAAGWISSHYGWRRDPISGRKNMHHGLDFAGKPGTEIVAVADGLVVAAESRSGYGRMVEIRHGNGYVTRYAHNRTLLVEKGDLVRQGQVIATMGSSGRTTGTHLHFEVIRDGKTVNPLRFVKSPVKQSDG